MKRLFAKWLSVLLVICLSLTIVPTALMEETVEPQVEAFEETTSVPVEENITEPAENVEEVTDVAEATDEVEEIQVDSVDEPVEEDAEAFSELPVMEAQDSDEFGQEVSDELPIEGEYEAQPLMAGENTVRINSTNFPDADFRQYVKDNFDWNGNGWLSDSEINAVTEIYLPHEYSESLERQVCDLDLNSIDGIEFFPNLTTLDCIGNISLETIDISLNTKLTELWCNDCGLGTLNVSSNLYLRSLFCNNNNLKTLDVSKNTLLADLDCDNNKIKTLNVANNVMLYYLSCGGNQLSTLDVSKNPGLEMLYAWGNQLTSLDISANTALTTLDCSNNKLTALNVSNNKNIEYLSCEENNIAVLDISDLAKLAPFVTDQYKRSNEEHFVVYAQIERYNEEIDGMEWDGSILYCDRATKLITTKPAPAPAPAPAPVIPTISAVKTKNKTTITAAPGAIYQLDLGGKTGRKFKSYKKKVATVDSTGLVTIHGAGKVRITFKVGKKKRTVKLTVKDPTLPTSISLNMSGAIFIANVGETITLKATLPAGAVSDIKWSTNNKKVASVSNGVVTFKRKGKVTITAKTTRGKKKAVVKFQVFDYPTVR